MAMGNDGYHSASHCKYLVQYHIIWCPKFRFDVLEGDVEAELKRILESICMKYGYAIKALEVMSDHVHIFVDVVRTLKSISAVEMFRAFPKLKRFYSRCGVLWSRGYFISSVGHVSEATVKKYIEEQKSGER